MTGFLVGFLGGIALGVIGNEAHALVPWATSKVVRLVARFDADHPSEIDDIYAEHMAGIGDRPGYLAELIIAFGLLFKVAIARRLQDGIAALYCFSHVRAAFLFYSSQQLVARRLRRDPAADDQGRPLAPAGSTEGPVDEPVVFINFRTGDEEASAILIERELSNRFGSKKIFRAEKSVPAGDDIETVIIGAVRRSSAVVAVIGPRWYGAVDEHGCCALDDARDWTRRELVEARRHGVRVIPVLIGSTTPYLEPAALPSDLRWLAGCKYLRLNYRDVDMGLARLVDQLAS